MTAIEFSSIELPQLISFNNIDWQQFNDILNELKNERIAYLKGQLTIVTPLPEHESTKGHISDVVKFFLKRQGRNYVSFGSTTFKNKELAVGIEPDECFYIENELTVRGATKLDIVPDLAIEIDITSKTNLETYRLLLFPEVWIWNDKNLSIYILKDGVYDRCDRSPHFPNLDLNALVKEYIRVFNNEGVLAAETFLAN